MQVNQQKRIGMVYTNNITYSKQIYKPFYWKPSHIVFLVKKRRSADAQILNNYLIELKNSHLRFSIKKTFLKNFAMFMGKHLCEVFKNTYFEENLHTAASELTL